MNVIAVTPIHVDPLELARRQSRYDRLAPEGLTIQVVDVGPDAPTELNTDSEVRSSESAVAARVRALSGQAPLVLPDCVLDPAVDAGVEVGGQAMTGVLRLAASHLAALGRPFGSVTRNPAISEELTRRLHDYGLAERHVGDVVLDLGFESVTDHAMWMSAVGGGLEELGRRGAVHVINGCSAVDVPPGEDPPHLVDPVQLALRLIGAGITAGVAE